MWSNIITINIPFLKRNKESKRYLDSTRHYNKNLEFWRSFETNKHSKTNIQEYAFNPTFMCLFEYFFLDSWRDKMNTSFLFNFLKISLSQVP